jgi:flagellar L-ring protein precursor FlgH
LALYEDIKAREVGDIITVHLTEVTTAIKSNETKLDKTSTATIIDPTILGTSAKFKIPKQIPVPLKTQENLNLQTTVNATRSFDGKGDSNQSNSLNGTITVTVTKVYPNGNLHVRGEKWVTLNTGDEFIRVSGIIRPRDIGSNNIIDSNRIADARISYSGRGEVHNSGNQGWLMKILGSKLWPI